jgi:hypothetical protein
MAKGIRPMTGDRGREKMEVIVRVISPFWDAKDGRDYQRGDVVVGWTAERAAWFAEQGLVVVMTTPLSPPSRGGRIGPSETKPGQTPRTSKREA